MSNFEDVSKPKKIDYPKTKKAKVFLLNVKYNFGVEDLYDAAEEYWNDIGQFKRIPPPPPPAPHPTPQSNAKKKKTNKKESKGNKSGCEFTKLYNSVF